MRVSHVAPLLYSVFSIQYVAPRTCMSHKSPPKCDLHPFSYSITRPRSYPRSPSFVLSSRVWSAIQHAFTLSHVTSADGGTWTPIYHVWPSCHSRRCRWIMDILCLGARLACGADSGSAPLSAEALLPSASAPPAGRRWQDASAPPAKHRSHF